MMRLSTTPNMMLFMSLPSKDLSHLYLYMEEKNMLLSKTTINVEHKSCNTHFLVFGPFSFPQLQSLIGEQDSGQSLFNLV